jgi:2-methylcitrate dehydratase PrpD
LDPNHVLSSFCAETTFADLPPSVVRMAKLTILDTLGCAIGTHVHDPEKYAVIERVVGTLGTARADATVIGGASKLSAPFAALANGVMCHGIDFDDVHGEALTHTSCVVLPAALASAEEAGCDGRAFITSFVLGFEVAVRFGMAVMPSHYDHWHSTATNGTFGAAVAAGRNYGFGRDQYVDALGFAATQAAGLLGFLKSGDYTKSFNPGKSAFNGVLSALMVKAGAKGPRSIIEDARSYTAAYSKSPNLAKLTRGLQDGSVVWEMLNNMLKPYPSLAASHTAMESTLRLVVENDLDPADIARIVDRTYGTVKSHFSRYDLDNVMAARLSVPYCIAVCAAQRSGGLDAFSAKMLADPAVRAMLEKVEIVADPELDQLYPEKFPSRIEITTNDGRAFRGGMDYAKGSPGNPFTEDEICEKFRSLAAPHMGAERVERIVRTVRNLEDVRDIGELGGLLG